MDDESRGLFLENDDLYNLLDKYPSINILLLIGNDLITLLIRKLEIL